MRDVLAGAVAIALLAAAASLATTLRQYRRRRERSRDSERALGRSIVAEIPSEDDLLLFSEDNNRFYYGERSIDKDLIVAVRMLVNGAPIASFVARGAHREQLLNEDSRSEAESGILRDRWDVAIETVTGTTIVACGAIRERVSQELARTVFDAVKRELVRRDSARR